MIRKYEGGEKTMGKLNTFQKHQLAIAKRTLKMPKEMVGVMGGMTKAQAKVIKARLENKKKKS